MQTTRENVAAAAPWGLTAAVAGLVIVLAGTATPPRTTPLSDGDARAVYADIVGREPAMRVASALAFPSDHWSQDDDFHAAELARARELAAAHHASPGDVLRALDEGLRAAWPASASAPPRATVPPCRPRLIY